MNSEDVAVDKVGELTGEDRDLLNKIAFATGKTSDVLEFETWERTKADHARGFLEAVSIFASDRQVAIMYHVTKTILTTSQG